LNSAFPPPRIRGLTTRRNSSIKPGFIRLDIHGTTKAPWLCSAVAISGFLPRPNDLQSFSRPPCRGSGRGRMVSPARRARRFHSRGSCARAKRAGSANALTVISSILPPRIMVSARASRPDF
jgi:hypothetical protein